VRRPDQLALRIVVGRFGVLVQVQAGKPYCALAIALIARVGQTEKVEVDVALALVELIVAPFILVQHRPELFQLSRDSVPLALPLREQVIAAPEQIVEGPVVGALVKIIGAVA